MLESLLNPSRGGLVLPLHKSDPVRLKQSKRTRFLTFILYLVLVIVVVFVGFNLFTIYNFSYRSPLLSVTNSNEKPEQVQQEDEQVLDISMEASSEFNPVIDEYMDERYLIQKLPFNDDPYMIKESTDYIGDIQQNDKGCDHTLDRDYRESPIRVMNRFEGEFEGCPIRCIGGGLFNAFPDVGIDVPMDQLSCPHAKSYQATMENANIETKDPHVIVGTTRLDTEVPVPYFSWAEYDFMNPPQEKTATAMMAVFISNCVPEKRLQVLSELMTYGVTVHSYGKCMNNAKIPTSESYLNQKTAVTSRYKFTFAAENSETIDYVTEKLFGTLAAGSVPVYLGAPNAQRFAPSPKSIILVSDFKTTKELADFIIMLDQDNVKYQEYLRWKTEGPSRNFMALVDKALVHSSCRLCIRVADHHRAMYGNFVGHEQKKTNLPNGVLGLRVRPRGEFYMKYIYLKESERNVRTLHAKIMKTYKDHNPKPGHIFSVYRLWDVLERAIDDEDFINGVVIDDTELEIIFTYPIHPERGKYYEWQKRSGMLP